MKSFLTLSRRSKRTSIFAALACVALLFNSCSKNDGYYQDTPSIAVVTVLNAFPSTNNLDFYLDGKKINNTGLSYGKNIDYFKAYDGTRKAGIALSGVETTILSKSLDIAFGNYYSIFVIGKQADALDFLLFKDNTQAPESSKAKIRFINLSPDAPALSLVVPATTEPAFDNVAYKSSSDFKSVSAGKVTLTVKSATSASLATLDVDIKPGNAYTIWVTGLVTPTGTTDKLTIQNTLNFTSNP